MHVRPHTKVLTAIGASVALAGLLSGCSGSATATGSSVGDSSSAAGAGTFAQDSNTLVVSSLPSENGTDPNAALDAYVGKKTGLTIKYVPTTSYSSLIAAGVAGQLDVAVFSGATYVTAKNKGAKLDVVSAEISSPGLTVPGYYSNPIVPNADASKYTTVKQFKGKKICFVDPTSTSGFFYPLLALQAAGIDVKPTGQDASGNPTFSDFTAYFAGTHPKSVQAVASGQCDVGFAEDTESEATGSGVTVVKDAAKAGDGKGRQLVPGSPIVISDTLPAPLKKKLTGLLSTVTAKTIKDAGVTTPVDPSFFGILPEKASFYQPLYTGCKDPSIAKAAAAVCG